MPQQKEQTPFGPCLQTLRKLHGFTQKALALAIPLHRTYLSDIERTQPPSLKMLEAIIFAFVKLGSPLTTGEQHDLELAFKASVSGATLPLATPTLFGRSREEAQVRKWLTNSKHPLFMLYGEAGIGKTHILQSAQQMAQHMGWTVFAGRWLSDRQLYEPLIDALTDSLWEKAATLTRVTWEKTQPLAAYFPGSIGEGHWSSFGDPRQDLAYAFGTLLRALAGDIQLTQGILLCLDDIHLANPIVVSLLKALVVSPQNTNGQLPIRVIATLRQDALVDGSPLFTERQNDHSQFLWYLIKPLSDAAAHQILLAHLQPDRRNQIPILLRYADNVPFCLIAYAQWANDHEVDANGAVWPIPDDIRELKRLQVESLPPCPKELLYWASVLGSEFSIRDLRLLVKWSDDELVAGLSNVTQRGMIVAKGLASPHQYLFTHDLLRMAIYESIPPSHRNIWHRAVATALAHQDATKPRDIELAHHWRAAEDFAHAYTAIFQAGIAARCRYAFEQAADFFQQGVQLAETTRNELQVAQAREHLGETLLQQEQMQAAIAMLETAAHLYIIQADAAGIGRVATALGEAYLRNRERPVGIQRMRELLMFAGEAMPAVERCQVHLAISKSLLFGHFYTEAEAELQEAQHLANALNDLRLQGQVGMLRGFLYDELLKPPESLQSYQSALIALEQAGDLNNVAETRMLMEYLYIIKGDFAAAHNTIKQLLLLAERMNSYHVRAIGFYLDGEVAYYEGHWERSEQDFRESIQIFKDLNHLTMYGVSLYFMGKVLHVQGKIAEAHALYDEALRCLDGDLWREQIIHLELAEEELLEGRPLDAHKRLRRLLQRGEGTEMNLGWLKLYVPWVAISLNDANAHEVLEAQIASIRLQENHLWLLDALRLRGWLALRDGDTDEIAASSLQEVIQRSRKIGYPHAEIKTRYVAGLLLQQQGAQVQAQEMFAEALHLCGRLGEQYYAQYIQRAMLVL